jgi:hypothetical protein
LKVLLDAGVQQLRNSGISRFARIRLEEKSAGRFPPFAGPFLPIRMDIHGHLEEVLSSPQKHIEAFRVLRAVSMHFQALIDFVNEDSQISRGLQEQPKR